MRIARVATRLNRVSPATHWEDSTHVCAALEYIVLELETEGGLTGTGFAYTIGVGGSAIVSLIENECAPLVAGLDIRDRQRIWSLLWDNLHRTGSGGTNTLAIAAIDIAVWDALARAEKTPLHRLLGGARPTIPVYASGIDYGMTADELEAHLESCRAAGYPAVKIKVGHAALRQDVERVRLARRTLGDDLTLLLDANQRWRVDEAVRRCHAFAEFNPGWIEEPLQAEDIEGHARLRRSTPIPIAVGESLYTKFDFMNYIRAGAVDIVQPDVARVGGFTEWLKISSLAEAAGLSVAPHFLIELSIQGLCAIPNGLMLENVFGGSLHETGLTESPIEISAGRAAPPERSGHGIELDLGAVDSRAIRRPAEAGRAVFKAEAGK
jgi:L-alanine-DL-glutamate epimerase-like enolase superfamily enzyme